MSLLSRRWRNYNWCKVSAFKSVEVKRNTLHFERPVLKTRLISPTGPNHCFEITATSNALPTGKKPRKTQFFRPYTPSTIMAKIFSNSPLIWPWKCTPQPTTPQLPVGWHTPKLNGLVWHYLLCLPPLLPLPLSTKQRPLLLCLSYKTRACAAVHC